MLPILLAQAPLAPGQTEQHTGGFPALLVIVIALIIFHGSIYAVISLNMGWLFGYWVAGATMGGLMVFLSLFWMTNTLGPRGEEGRWFAIAADKTSVGETKYGGKTYSGASSYPGGAWRSASKPSDKLFIENDTFRAAVSNCVSFDDTKVEQAKAEMKGMTGHTATFLEGKFHRQERAQRELDTCRRVTRDLEPPDESIPTVQGTKVSVLYDLKGIRFTKESGTLLAQATIVPDTYDKRVTGDPAGKKPLQVGDTFRILAYKDTGSLRYPAGVFLMGSILFFAFHLWGLNRAERRKMSPLLGG